MPQIDKLTRGSTPTLLEASKGNDLIDAINGLLNMKSSSEFVDVDVGNNYSVKIDTPSLSSETFEVVGQSNTAQSVSFVIVGNG